MKLALIIAVWKRHDLEKIVIDRFKAQSKKFGFEIIIAGSEGEVSEGLAKGCHYIEVANSPLSGKYNSLVDKAKEIGCEAVVAMGSDDMVDDNYWKWIKSLDNNSDQIHGLSDLYFYSTRTKEFAYWKGYRNSTQVAGAGKFFSKAVLDACNWKVWPDNLEFGLDTGSYQRMKSLGISEVGAKMSEHDIFLVDIKHTVSITNPAIIKNCEPKNFEIMAKKVGTATAKKVEKLTEEAVKAKEKNTYDHSKSYVFVANSMSNHLKRGKQYTVNGEMAEILSNKGYGEVIAEAKK